MGPYRSTDSGATWKQIYITASDPTLQGFPKMLSMVADPKDPMTVYSTALFGSVHAFMKSTDGAQTWSAIPQPDVPISDLLSVDCANTNVFYVLADVPGGMVKSSDGGVTWTGVTFPAAPIAGVQSPRVYGIATDPKVSGVVYALGPGSVHRLGRGFVFKSADFGNTWSVLADGTDFAGHIFVDPSNNQVLYAGNIGAANGDCQATASNGGMCGLYKSTDGGKTWVALPLRSSVAGNLAIDAKSGVIYVGVPLSQPNSALMKSTDGGNTWTSVPATFFLGAPSVRTDPNVSGTVYATANVSATIVYRSTDSGATWSSFPIPQGCNTTTEKICSFDAFIDDFVVAAAPQGPPVQPSQPTLSTNGVVSGASFKTGITSNSWVTIFGTNLASKTDDWSTAVVNGKLPTTLDGVSVTIGGKPAYVEFVSPTQISVLAPDVSGNVSVTVTNAGGTSAVQTVTVSQYAPAFFLWPNNQVVATRQDYTYAVKNGTFSGVTTVAAKPGDVLILWGTGFGPSNPPAPSGVAVPTDQPYSAATMPQVTINSVSAMVFGAALAPGSAGLYQVAILVPNNLADGDWPLQATIGGVTSPIAVLSVKH
ncbi:MAG TPA: IPT/TIG domain-containing protein [Bryobacteraceae bacterium]|nr:IPT/TIG domain-containing protein [Bryobacteraceae bacterium]